MLAPPPPGPLHSSPAPPSPAPPPTMASSCSCGPLGPAPPPSPPRRGRLAAGLCALRAASRASFMAPSRDAFARLHLLEGLGGGLAHCFASSWPACRARPCRAATLPASPRPCASPGPACCCHGASSFGLPRLSSLASRASCRAVSRAASASAFHCACCFSCSDCHTTRALDGLLLLHVQDDLVVLFQAVHVGLGLVERALALPQRFVGHGGLVPRRLHVLRGRFCLGVEFALEPLLLRPQRRRVLVQQLVVGLRPRLERLLVLAS